MGSIPGNLPPKKKERRKEIKQNEKRKKKEKLCGPGALVSGSRVGCETGARPGRQLPYKSSEIDIYQSDAA